MTETIFKNIVQSKVTFITEVYTGITKGIDDVHIVGNYEHSPTCRTIILEKGDAFRLKRNITNCESFIYDKDLGFNVNRNGERKPNEHTARIRSHWLIYKTSDVREGLNTGESLAHLIATQSEQ